MQPICTRDRMICPLADIVNWSTKDHTFEPVPETKRYSVSDFGKYAMMQDRNRALVLSSRENYADKLLHAQSISRQLSIYGSATDDQKTHWQPISYDHPCRIRQAFHKKRCCTSGGISQEDDPNVSSTMQDVCWASSEYSQYAKIELLGVTFFELNCPDIWLSPTKQRIFSSRWLCPEFLRTIQEEPKLKTSAQTQSRSSPEEPKFRNARKWWMDLISLSRASC